MKKCIVLLAVFCLASMASAATVELVIDSMISGVQNEDFGELPSYEPSTWLKIGVVNHDFGTGAPDGVFEMKLDLAGDGGTGANPGYDSGFTSDLSVVGTAGAAPDLLVGMHVQSSSTDFDPIPDGTLMGWIEFHVPDVPYSTIITIDVEQLVLKNAFGIELTGYTILEPLEIHVSPEPMTVALLGLGGLFLRRRK